jgi:hypothetical protein
VIEGEGDVGNGGAVGHARNLAGGAAGLNARGDAGRTGGRAAARRRHYICAVRGGRRVAAPPPVAGR